MKVNNIVYYFLLLFLVSNACNDTKKPAMDKSSENPFVGTWKFVSLVAESTDGDVFYPYGENIYGKLMYDDKGHMSFLAMRPNRPKFAAEDIYNGTAEEYKTAFLNFDAYCGTYKRDTAKKTITHFIEGCRYPNWEGTEQMRHYEFSEKGLTLSATMTFQNKKWQLKAVLIRQSQKPEKMNLRGEQLVIGYMDMWNNKDLGKADLIFTDDCIYEDVPSLEKYSGKEEVKASLQEDFTWCSDLKLELVSSFVTQDRAAVEWIWSGKQTGDISGLIKATGKTFSIRGTSIMEFKNGKIKRNSDYYDGGGFLYQLGVKLTFPSGKVMEKDAIIKKRNKESNHRLELEQTRTKLQEALLKGDTKTLGSLWADDYTLTTRYGKILTKSQRITSIESGKLRYLKTEEHNDLKIRLYRNTAVVTGLGGTITNREGKKIVSDKKRFTEVYIYENGSWKMVARHASPVNQG
jgi:steroid delta-isomerase-like uncharacterized protein